MGTVKSLEFASFTLGLLGILATLLVWFSPRPGPDILPGTPSAQACKKWFFKSWSKEEDFSCFQWLFSLDVGLSDIVEASGFPDMIYFVIVHILANISLLYGVFQSNTRFLMIFITYYILTNILGFISALSLPVYESNLFAMCIFPIESSVLLLYGSCWFLVLFVSVMRAVLYLCTVLLLLKIDFNDKGKVKPVSKNKMQGDSVFVIPV